MAILPAIARAIKQYLSPSVPGNVYGGGDRGSWWFPVVREPFTGAWQRNLSLRPENILAFHAVYACLERIASDVAKCRIRLVEQDARGIWTEIEAPAFSPVLRKPNHYQTRIQFFESWMLSKLMSGNCYVLKERDARRVVIGLYVLDPSKVRLLVAPDGDVLYELSTDNLSGVAVERIVVPASEIIHDMMTLKYHPLCGLSPMAPASLAAVHGITIQRTSTNFFANSATPSGAITYPGAISDDEARRLKEEFESGYSGANTGRFAILAQGMKFEKIGMDFIDAQLIEQLNISAKMVCSSFGVPPHMVQVGESPTFNNIETLNQQYYSQTLQKHFEAIELLLDEGLGLTEVPQKTYGTWFDLDDLLRMDTKTLVEAEAAAVKAGIKAPDESRLKLNLGPNPGGGGQSAYLQQQNYSLAALAKRDALDDPFASPSAPASSAATDAPAANDNAEDDSATEADAAATRAVATQELRRCLM